VTEKYHSMVLLKNLVRLLLDVASLVELLSTTPSCPDFTRSAGTTQSKSTREEAVKQVYSQS